MASPAPVPTSTSTTSTTTAASTSPALLTATYTSPTNAPFTHTQTLPSLPPSDTQSTAAKTAYLCALRQATSQMQEVINKELTARMEEDNARVAEEANGKENGNGTRKMEGVDEKKEEENYGEEVVDED